MKHEGDGGTNFNVRVWNDPQGLDKRAGRVENRRSSRDHPNNSILEVGHNIEKCPGDLRRLTVTQTPVKTHQLTLMWKKSQGIIIIIISARILRRVLGIWEDLLSLKFQWNNTSECWCEKHTRSEKLIIQNRITRVNCVEIDKKRLINHIGVCIKHT